MKLEINGTFRCRCVTSAAITDKHPRDCKPIQKGQCKTAYSNIGPIQILRGTTIWFTSPPQGNVSTRVCDYVHRGGSLSGRSPWTETTHPRQRPPTPDRDPHPEQIPPWTETPQTETPGQRPPDRDPLDRDPHKVTSGR